MFFKIKTKKLFQKFYGITSENKVISGFLIYKNKKLNEAVLEGEHGLKYNVKYDTLKKIK